MSEPQRGMEAASTSFIRLDRACSDRVVRVHKEGTPDQSLETLDKTKHFVANSVISGDVEVTLIDNEEAAA